MKRTEVIQIRLTKNEKTDLKNRADRADLTMSETVRQLIQEGPVMDPEPFHNFVLELGRIGTNLYRISRWAQRHKENAETNRVLIGLLVIEREIRSLQSSIPDLEKINNQESPANG